MSLGSDGTGERPVRILLLEDSARDAELIQLTLATAGIRFSALRVDAFEAFSRALDEFRPDIILSDYRLLGFDGRTALATVQEHCPATPMLMVTGAIGDELAVELIKAGARDYVLKDRLARLPSAVQRAMAEAEETRQRQAAEKALRESEASFRTLAENAPDVIVRYDREGRRIYVNPEFERAFGLKSQDALGGSPDDASTKPAPMAAAFTDKLLAAMKAGTADRIDLDWEHDGRRSCWFVRIVPEHDGEGRVVSALTIWSDISERKAMETALRASEQEFRSLAENSPDIIMRCDTGCRHTYVNPAFVRETGIPAERAMNLRPDALWPDNGSAAEYERRLRQVIATGAPAGLVLSWPRPAEGTTVHHELRIVAEHIPDDGIKGALAIGRNITALVEAKRQLEESRTQLRTLAARREAAREEERRSIARELHDELGQQLSALRIGVNLIDFQFGDAEPRIREATKKLLGLVDQTIQTTRDVSSSLRPAVLDMGLVPALEWLTAEFSRHTGIACDLKVPHGDVRVPEDMGVALFRIAQESLTNAARHSKADRVQVRFECDPEACVLEVEDDGEGFDPARGRRQKSFGLVGIRERALAAGGEAFITSDPGRGATVTVRIPMAPPEETES